MIPIPSLLFRRYPTHFTLDGWQSFPAGRADRDGFLLCTSRFNTDMVGFTSDVQQFFDSKHDNTDKEQTQH